MEARETHWVAGPAPTAVLVPIFADREWWGFLWLARQAPAAAPDPMTEEVGCLIATILGNSVRDASIAQALRWSERLHRIQRDIALAAGSGGSTGTSISELLGLVCEFGDFDAGTVDLYEDGAFVRIATHGSPPGESPQNWCTSCRMGLLPHRGSSEARYLAEDEHDAQCPVSLNGFHAVGFVPMVGNGEIVGAIELFSSSRSHVPMKVRRTVEGVTGEVSMLLAQVRAEETRRRIQTELEQAQLSAERLSRAKSDFMARMSHEFRTPLNAILGYVQMLRVDGIANSEADDAVVPLDRIEQTLQIGRCRDTL
ncbi:MAG: histidine kinase dimerization/phospho-acceptor domain-containing protein, partial [Spirochaetota bacterium]